MGHYDEQREQREQRKQEYDLARKEEMYAIIAQKIQEYDQMYNTSYEEETRTLQNTADTEEPRAVALRIKRKQAERLKQDLELCDQAEYTFLQEELGQLEKEIAKLEFVQKEQCGKCHHPLCKNCYPTKTEDKPRITYMGDDMVLVNGEIIHLDAPRRT